jgi:hypothetical protein
VALPDPIPAATGPADVEPPPMPGLRGLTALAVGVVIVFALYFGKVPRVVAVVFSVALAIAILVGRWHFSCYSVRRYRRRSAEIPKHNRRENRWSAECHRWTDFTAHRAGANGA